MKSRAKSFSKRKRALLAGEDSVVARLLQLRDRTCNIPYSLAEQQGHVWRSSKSVELKAVVSYPVRMLGTELRSPERAVCALNL